MAHPPILCFVSWTVLYSSTRRHYLWNVIKGEWEVYDVGRKGAWSWERTYRYLLGLRPDTAREPSSIGVHPTKQSSQQEPSECSAPSIPHQAA